MPSRAAKAARPVGIDAARRAGLAGDFLALLRARNAVTVVEVIPLSEEELSELPEGVL